MSPASILIWLCWIRSVSKYYHCYFVMASSVRFDTSAKHLNQQNLQTASPQMKIQETANHVAKQLSSGSNANQSQRLQQQSTQHLTKQFRSSPVKHTSSSGSYSNITPAQDSSGNKDYEKKYESTSLSQNKSDQKNALAAQLFSSSDDDEDYQASDNYGMGEEDGGDPLTCGDSDFEPAEPSIRGVVPFHQQQKDPLMTQSYFSHETNNILQGYNDFDHDSQILYHGHHKNYQDAIDYKLTSEHEIGGYSGINMFIDNAKSPDKGDTVIRIHSATTQETKSSRIQSQNKFDHTSSANPGAPAKNQVSSNNLQNDTINNQKDQFKFEADDQGKSNTAGKLQNQNANQPQQSMFRTKYAKLQQDAITNQQNIKTFEAAKGSKKIQQILTNSIDKEDDDMVNQAQLNKNFSLVDNKTGSTNVRRFARGTGTYQSSFSKPVQSEQQSMDSETEYYRQPDRYKHDSSYTSEENDILIDREFKSKYYYNDSYPQSEIEMKELKNQSFHSSHQQDNFQNEFYDNARKNQKNSTNNKNQNAMTSSNMKWVEEQPEDTADMIDNQGRFKSTAVGFSPNQQVYGFSNNSAKKSDENKDEKTQGNGKSLTSLGWNQNEPQRKKQQSSPARTMIFEQQQQTISQFDQAKQYGQYAMLYPQKQISKETWETQNKNVQSTTTPVPQTQKDKRKKKKESAPEAHFLLTGSFTHHLESRSFFRNSEDQKTNKTTTSQIVETQNQPDNNEAGSREALMEWFGSLSEQDRVNSLTTTYPIFVSSIIEAQSKHVQPQNPLCLFTIKKDRTMEAASVDTAAGRRRTGQQNETETILERVANQDDAFKGYNNMYSNNQFTTRSFQSKIMKLVRITSNKQHMDTLTVKNDLVKEPQEFFSFMDNLTDGKAFSQPISFVTRNQSGRRPLIQSPKWIDNKKSNYLGVWIVAILEETLWAHFNFAKQVNLSAGVRINELSTLFELRKENLQNQQEDLAKRWTEIGEEGRQKLINSLNQIAKEKQPQSFQQQIEEQERRNPPLYQHQPQYNEDIFPFCTSQNTRFGLYSYQETSLHKHSEMYRSDIDYSVPYTTRFAEQQGYLANIQTASKSSGGDTDLKEIIDMAQYVNALDLIKYLGEVPLHEVNHRTHIRKHFLCQELYSLIKDDLRLSIMNELLASDTSTHNKSSIVNSEQDDKKGKNKKKQDIRKNKRKPNGQQQNATVQAPTYQKKKSISKSPNREPSSIPIQASQAQQLKPSDSVKMQIKQGSQQTGGGQSNVSEMKEAVSRVASTTTSDDQMNNNTQNSHHDSGKKNIQKGQEKITSGKAQHNRKDKKQLPVEQQVQKKTSHTKLLIEMKPIQQLELEKEKQVIILTHVKQLLDDLVENVVALEAERVAHFELSQCELEKAQTEQASRETKADFDTDDSATEDKQSKPVAIATVAATKKPEVAETKTEGQATTASKRRRRNTKKKQDAEELVNNFVRKLHGGDHDTESESSSKNQGVRNNKNGQATKSDMNNTQRGFDRDNYGNGKGQFGKDQHGQKKGQQGNNMQQKQYSNNSNQNQNKVTEKNVNNSNKNLQAKEEKHQKDGLKKQQKQQKLEPSAEISQVSQYQPVKETEQTVNLSQTKQLQAQLPKESDKLNSDPIVPIPSISVSPFAATNLDQQNKKNKEQAVTTPKIKPSAIMSETPTIVLFSIPNQPTMIIDHESWIASRTEQNESISIENSISITDDNNLASAEDILSQNQTEILIKPDFQEPESGLKVQVSMPVREKINLMEHFSQPVNLNAFVDLKNMDEMFENQNNQQQIYENSRIQFIDYSNTNQIQQPPVSKITQQVQQKSNTALADTPLQWSQVLDPKGSSSADDQSAKIGIMSTTSVSFTPTLQLSPQISLLSSDEDPSKGIPILYPAPSQESHILFPLQNQSPPLTKFIQNLPSHNNFLPAENNMYMKSQQHYGQSQYDTQPLKTHYSAPFNRHNQSNDYQHIQKMQTGIYKKQQAPFRQSQYQHQQFIAPAQQQFGNKSPTNSLQPEYNPHYNNSLQNDHSNFQVGNNPRIGKNISSFQGGKKNIEHSGVIDQQQQYLQPYYQQFSGSPNANDTSKTLQIRIDAPSFEPVVYRDNVSNFQQQTQANIDFRKHNWGQANFLAQQQQSSFQKHDPQLNVSHFQQNAQSFNDFALAQKNQHPLFLSLENQFYQNFDKDIAKTFSKIQSVIDKFEEERAYILKKLQNMANLAFPGRTPQIKVFGSLMTGLALETSDMDIAVTGLRIDGREDMIDDLHALGDQVQKWNLIKDFKSIETASIPVIKAILSLKEISNEIGKPYIHTDPDAQLPIDITFDDSPTEVIQPPIMQHPQQQFQSPDYHMMNVGVPVIPPHPKISTDPMMQLQNLISGELGFNITDSLMGYGMEFGGPPPPKTHLGLASCNLLKEYVRTYPHLKEVAVLLKRFLALNNLNQSYLGGISSYSAVLLIVAYMNNFQLHLSPHLTPSRLLMGFLDFYSNCFDPRHYGVNTSKGMSFYPLPQVNQHMFVIVDPVNPTNNTARNSFRTPDVLNHFRAAFFCLKSQITKEFNKQLAILETERSQKNDLEMGVKVMTDLGEKASSYPPVSQQFKVEKTSDGSGQRLRQGAQKKNNAQSQQDPTAAKASEQQQPSSSSAGQTVTTTNQLFLKGAVGTSGGLNLPTTTLQAFEQTNFVDSFLSSDILREGTDKQANVLEALSGFGGVVF